MQASRHGRYIVPVLKEAGITDERIDGIFVENPRRLFGGWRVAGRVAADVFTQVRSPTIIHALFGERARGEDNGREDKQAGNRRWRKSGRNFFIGLAERYLPEAFLFAVVLTIIVYVLDMIFVTTDILALIAPFFL